MSKNRIEGTLLGAAIGDALGAPYEFKHAGSFKVKGRGYDYGVFGTTPGGPTDDSTLVRLHAEAWVEAATKLPKAEPHKPEHFKRLRTRAFAIYADKLIDWKDSGPPDIGGQTSSAISAMKSGREVMETTSSGNGSVMAVCVVGLVAPTIELCADTAEMFSNLTHRNAIARLSCRQVACAVWRMVHGDRFYRVAREMSLPVPAGMAVDGGSMGFSVLTAAVAFDALKASQGVSPYVAIYEALERGGDVDTNGAVAGALLGAGHGVEAWTERRWILDGLEGREHWAELANELHKRYG